MQGNQKLVSVRLHSLLKSNIFMIAFIDLWQAAVFRYTNVRMTNGLKSNLSFQMVKRNTIQCQRYGYVSKGPTNQLQMVWCIQSLHIQGDGCRPQQKSKEMKCMIGNTSIHYLHEGKINVVVGCPLVNPSAGGACINQFSQINGFSQFNVPLLLEQCKSQLIRVAKVIIECE